MKQKDLWEKRVFVILIGLVFMGFAFWILNRRTEAPTDIGIDRPVVVTTLFPLYDMARFVGGDDADVSLLLPPGIEPHSFEPTPADIVRIGEADVFVYTGDAMEPWAKDVLSGTGRRDLLAVDASEGIAMRVGSDGDEHGHEGEEGMDQEDDADADLEEEEGHHHDHGGLDPHIWLDFDNAAVMVRHVAAALSEADPSHAAAYADRAEKYVSGLSDLDRAYRDGLAVCKSRTIVYGGHYAFGYLAARYGLSYEAAQGFSPDAEPTAKDLARLVGQVRRERLSAVFAEELSSPKIAETIAAETGATVFELDAAHNLTRDEAEHSVSFFDIMRRNLDTLRQGLSCE
ncbi:MAG: zinc ABC transporter solute-binding protein [Candidatus Moranbacteria bacterium]|nr:zinc ABC transporter solute-binding protein [Candidatus Moranbacteria bacterium]